MELLVGLLFLNHLWTCLTWFIKSTDTSSSFKEWQVVPCTIHLSSNSSLVEAARSHLQRINSNLGTTDFYADEMLLRAGHDRDQRGRKKRCAVSVLCDFLLLHAGKAAPPSPPYGTAPSASHLSILCLCWWLCSVHPWRLTPCACTPDSLFDQSFPRRHHTRLLVWICNDGTFRIHFGDDAVQDPRHMAVHQPSPGPTSNSTDPALSIHSLTSRAMLVTASSETRP